jgi:hypothetical protein
MRITKTSPFTGRTNTMELPVTNDQMRRFYRGDGYIQDIFPDLSAGQREFILTGITEEEWSVHIGEE